MKISVVTITYNNPKELEKTLSSIHELIVNNNIESVIINGGKNKETIDLLEKSSSQVILSEPDSGISDAFNKGIYHSNGDYLCFLNSGDILIDAEYYKWATNYFIKNPEVDYIYADIIFHHLKHGDLILKPNIETGKIPYPHPSLIVKKSIFKSIGGFDVFYKLAMDFDFMYRLIQGGHKGYYYSEKPVIFMMGDGVSSQNGIQGIKERIHILNKYNLLDRKSYRYLKVNLFKNRCRNLLTKFHMIEIYDSIKRVFKEAKPE